MRELFLEDRELINIKLDLKKTNCAVLIEFEKNIEYFNKILKVSSVRIN